MFLFSAASILAAIAGPARPSRAGGEISYRIERVKRDEVLVEILAGGLEIGELRGVPTWTRELETRDAVDQLAARLEMPAPDRVWVTHAYLDPLYHGQGIARLGYQLLGAVVWKNAGSFLVTGSTRGRTSEQAWRLWDSLMESHPSALAIPGQRFEITDVRDGAVGAVQIVAARPKDLPDLDLQIGAMVSRFTPEGQLLRLLGHPNPMVRIEAVRQLTDRGMKWWSVPLLSDSDPDVVRTVVQEVWFSPSEARFEVETGVLPPELEEQLRRALALIGN